MKRTLLLVAAAAWGGLLVFDTLVFVMTVAKAIHIGRSGDRALIKVLLRDGKCTFVFQLKFSLAKIVYQVLYTSCRSYSKLAKR
jgi:hypothetical protein